MVGFIKAEVSDWHPERLIIDNLFIEADYRKRGIGTRLMSYVEDLFKKDKNITEVYLWVAKQNIEAEKLYKNRGFKLQEDLYKKYKKEL